jgi:hypothetical protein
MKPTAPLEDKFSVFATTPFRGFISFSLGSTGMGWLGPECTGWGAPGSHELVQPCDIWFGSRLMDGSPVTTLTMGRAGHDFINDPLMLYGSRAE